MLESIGPVGCPDIPCPEGGGGGGGGTTYVHDLTVLLCPRDPEPEGEQEGQNSHMH